MPYIRKDLRDLYKAPAEAMAAFIEKAEPSQKAGILNYYITKLLDGAYKNKGYREYCEINGILGGVDKEFYRRRTAPYEDKKIQENGDVFT